MDNETTNNGMGGGAPSGGSSGGNDKVIAIIGYLIFFVPLLIQNKSQFLTYHANQALVLFILAFGGNVILGLIPVIGWIIMPLFAIFTLILMIMGMINASKNLQKPLPLIGHFQIIK